ncbi:MAG: tetratricopeptide repeat protein, partial [Myxococcota bacterium]
TLAMGKLTKAIELYEEALRTQPEYRGTKWALARLMSQRKNDAALNLIDELEKSAKGTKGPEYQLFRGRHALRKGDLEEARARFTAAADLGDDPDILFGLARVTFEEEKRKGKRANLDKVAVQMTRVLDQKRFYPEAHEYVGDVSLWNFLVTGAHKEYEQAERDFKTLKRPVPEIVGFYDRVISSFRRVKDRSVRRKARKMATVWQKKKQAYLASILAG